VCVCAQCVCVCAACVCVQHVCVCVCAACVCVQHVCVCARSVCVCVYVCVFVCVQQGKYPLTRMAILWMSTLGSVSTITLQDRRSTCHAVAGSSVLHATYPPSTSSSNTNSRASMCSSRVRFSMLRLRVSTVDRQTHLKNSRPIVAQTKVHNYNLKLEIQTIYIGYLCIILGSKVILVSHSMDSRQPLCRVHTYIRSEL